MGVYVITPAAPFVTLDEAKAHLRVDYADDDDLISGMIAAACAEIDGPDGDLRRAIGEQTLELRVNGAFWECSPEFELPFPPLIEVEEVGYLDADGDEQIVPSDDYIVIGGAGRPAKIAPTFNGSWPSARRGMETIRVRYRAGYQSGVADVPAPLRQAVLLMVGQFYEHRGENQKRDMVSDPTIDRLTRKFRVPVL